MEIPDDIKRILDDYLQKLGKKIKIEAVYLFGSTARGERLDTSDVDLLIVSPSVEGMWVDERIRIAYRIWRYSGLTAHIFLLTPNEFKQRVNESVALRNAQKYWIRIS